jgi:hypothetical protein
MRNYLAKRSHESHIPILKPCNVVSVLGLFAVANIVKELLRHIRDGHPRKLLADRHCIDPTVLGNLVCQSTILPSDSTLQHLDEVIIVQTLLVLDH